jgi:alpha-tubulin suppressor-like RCC1 family protein
LWIWGSNFYGQLGVGSSGSVSGNSHGSITGGSSGNVPQMWNNFTNAKDICYGWAHAVAIKNDGSVWVWGNNSKGRIGNGSTSTNQYTPLQPGISGGRSCYANEEHSQVVTNGNALYSWGDNDYGEIGNKVTTDVASPSQFTQVSDIDSSSIGRDSAHVIRNGITVYGWGRNNNGGSVGNGSTTNTTAAHAWDFTVPSMREW